MCDPTRNRDIADVACTMQKTRLRIQQQHEADIKIIVRHFVQNTLGCVVQSVQAVQMTASHPLNRVRLDGFEDVEGACLTPAVAAAAQGLEILACQTKLTSAEDARMAGQHLF